MSKHLLVRVIPVLAASAAVAVAFSPASPADASEVTSAAACFVEQNNDEDYLFGRGIVNQSSGLGSRPRRVVCPITNTTAQPRANITSLFVSGFDGNNDNNANGRARARVCTTQFNGVGITCSAIQELSPGTTSGPFDTALNAALLGALTGAPGFDYAHLHVFLPQQDVLGNSQLYGYTLFP